MISVGVTAPGSTRSPRARARSTTALLRPGLTTKEAPAFAASSTWSGRTTVPAPTIISVCRAIARMDATAAELVEERDAVKELGLI